MTSASPALQRLPTLGLARTLAMAVSNARRRAVRSILTIASIALGVAFISYIAGTSVLDAARVKKLALVVDEAKAQQDAARAREETAWIVAVSLLVCTVGIANAMLMSVTERYQEIGTIKCLGALDGFVLKLFLLEAAGQGVIGGVAGLVVGTALAAVGGLFGEDPVAWGGVAGGTWLGYTAACLVVGVVLSILAAVYPAWVAMRMAPIEALRARF